MTLVHWHRSACEPARPITEERDMSYSPSSHWSRQRVMVRLCVGIGSLLILPALAYAQSPWERAAGNLELSFTGPLARSLALVAIVVGGLMFMYGEAGAKRQISGIVFGGGLALFAAQFLTWLF
jgi:type IV secretory pathway VirB2 component (pilin)